MKKAFRLLTLLACLLAFQSVFATTESYQVSKSDIYGGFISEKIWLNNYAMPQVAISGISYEPNAVLPKGARLSDPNKLQVVLGMEKRRPFAVVRVPAYAAGTTAGQVNQVSGFTLTISEQPAVKSSNAAAKTAANTTTSVLATGTWYKIGITQTGFYKIDNNFISTLVPKPANASISNLRIFGNGGRILSENNAIPRAVDLVENAFQNNGNTSAVFYAVGPTGWSPDTNKLFVHEKNIYSDTAYYFITFDQGSGLQVQSQPATAPGNKTVTDFDYYDVHDTDLISPAQFGKLWYGEGFYPQAGNTNQSFTFDLHAPASSLYCKIGFGHTSPDTLSQVVVSLNGAQIGSEIFHFCTPNGSDDKMAYLTNTWTGACNSQTAKIGIEFIPSNPSAVGYLDYIEINARRSLTMAGDQMSFRDLQDTGAGNIINYQLQGANSNTQVWDVTNPQVPVLMAGTLNGGTYTFTQEAGTLHEFAAMSGLNAPFYTPKFASLVPNQNLHEAGQVDCIIVTYPGFTDAAEKLATYHRAHDHMRVKVATTTQIYNEFSSGAQDLSAIRDFVRMYYKRATDASGLPSYLVLLGGGSYDYKNRLSNNCNFVPVFESAESYNDLFSFCSDDFYGFLDDSENIEDNSRLNALDVGIGRLPARSVADATSLVDKVISYTDPATLGPWRISASVVADKDDGAGPHMDVAENMAASITAKSNGLYNIDKVYLDAIPGISTPAGSRCPNANAAINNDIFKGVFMINYNGHGNTGVWAGDRILTQDDYNSWTNKYKLPFMVTATCDFGQFDHPQYVSAAEQLVIRSGGGAIAMLTTTQAVYSSYNETLNKSYLYGQFVHNPDYSWNSFGEASRMGKNSTYYKSVNVDELANFRKFGLLGDPALMPDFPRYNINIDSVVEGTTMEHADTVKALGAYIVNGSVHDNNGNLMTDFNGFVWITFYDKPRIVNTLFASSSHKNFKLQDNIVYKGKASVVNGVFSISFITPKDINYYYGKGKISTYAHNGIIDAAGTDTSFAVGGYSDHPQLSSISPLVKPYINDTFFLNGGITGSNTSLFVSLYDSTGINVSGNNVGHDLIAILDDKNETPYLLNDYYETDPNTYKHGTLSFPLTNLSNGRHTIRVRAWDVNDNMGEGTVDFMVVDGSVMDITNLMTYPNPFSNSTHFSFEHNHPDEQLDTHIEIYNTSGALAKEIHEIFTPTGSRSHEIIWDGRDNSGRLLPSGVYIYRLNVSTDKGFKSSAYQKLVIVR
jgi:hypothetical protein